MKISENYPVVLRDGLPGLASPLIPEDYESIRLTIEEAGNEDGGFEAPLFCCGECGSTFDVAWGLVREGHFPVWASVAALSQSGGRGQLRRHWHSPEGNLYVTFRLPLGPGEEIFSGEAASVITAYLCLKAFAGLGLNLALKWPNDLALPLGGLEEYGKVGGLLLEERDGVLLAGLGINCLHRPPEELLRRDAAMAAAVLPGGWLEKFERPGRKTGLRLWFALVRRLIVSYVHSDSKQKPSDLLVMAEPFLAWKGREILLREVDYPEQPLRGTLLGLSSRGGLRLLTHENRDSSGRVEREVFSGGISPFF